MKRTLLVTVLILGLLIPSVALGVADPKPVGKQVIIRTPDFVILDVTMSDNTHRIVIVVRGHNAKELMEECQCTGGEIPDRNIVILLQPDIDI